MNMKWNPIIDGDLSGIPRNEEFLFTIFDEINRGTYVNIAWIVKCEGKLQVRETTIVGAHIVEAKNVKAWMELPEPYQPGRCDICNQCRVFIDGSGNRWSKCELPGFATFVPLKKCPLKK